MKIKVVLFAVLTAAVSAFSAVKESIWPEGKIPDFQSHQIAAMTDVSKKPGFDADKNRMPYLEWYDPPAAGKANGACMILISGGSYQCCCDVGLVKMWREKLTEAGFQCVNFVYRTPRPKGIEYYRSAWQDGQRAVRIVRSQAARRGFNPEKIGAIGMSAGGHLTCLLATSSLTPAYAKVDGLDDIPCHLNWAVANAPAYNTLTAGEEGIARPQDGTTVVDLKVSPAFKFDAKTCPISFHHGGNDPYTPNGSTQCYRELRKRKIPAELHLYADKSHGAFGFERALEFMRQMNFDGRLANERGQDRRYTVDGTKCTGKVALWPEGKAPDPRQDDKYEPYLVWYIPEKLKTKAIQVIVPGGGYHFCNYNGEGVPVAHYFNSKGMTAVVVMYRCGRHPEKAKHHSAWQDAQRAVRLVRAGAFERGLDPDRIGIMGFSAGGHLSVMTAVNAQTRAYQPVDSIDELSCKLQWACPIYPAYLLTDGADSPNVNGGNLDDSVLVPEFSFDADTPPMCFVHGDSDGWAAMNSVKMWEKLRSMGIQCDLHTLAKRGHCFQFNAAPGTGSYTYLDRIWEFLTVKGFNK